MIEIIPAIDIIDGKCVRLSQGDYARQSTYAVTPADMVKQYLDCGLRRIHVVDLDGAKSSHPVNLSTLETLAKVDGTNIEWGGGVKTDIAIHEVINAGARHIVIGSVAANEPHKFSSWLTEYGNERIVLGADTKHGKIAVNGWLEQSTITVDQLIDGFTAQGLSQVICTDISKDGMLQGPAYELYTALQNKYPDITFTVSGGIGSMDDIKRLNDLGLKRVIVGKAIYEGKISLTEISHFINSKQ
jgi:phosphoribosylformimino-5-aminoimidazole carboxamide ribotide isomerase